MQVMHQDAHLRLVGRRAGTLDLWAAALLLATVVLHVIAMLPDYFGGAGQGSLWSQPDEAALYGVVAAGWALALGLFVTAPAQARAGAALAVGIAAVEFGFRVSDLGEVVGDGGAQAAAGLWLMTAAWVVGAVAAVTCVLAVRRRDRPVPAPAIPSIVVPSALAGGEHQPNPEVPPALPASTHLPEAHWAVDHVPLADSSQGQELGAPIDRAQASEWEPQARPMTAALDANTSADTPGPTLPAANGAVGPPVPVDAAGRMPADPTVPVGADPTRQVPVDPTVPVPVETTRAIAVDARAGEKIPTPRTAPGQDDRSGPYGAGLTVLVVLIALVTAGAFLPAWDHYVGVSVTTGRSVSFNLGNAFSGPWQVVIGNVLVVVALVAVPILATRLRDRAVAAAAVAGSLIVLASQFASAIVQVDRPVPAAVAGLTPSQASQLGLQLHMSLTAWFTLDVLAAYALFAFTMVIGHLKPVGVQANSPGTWPTAPDARSAASLPWS